MGSQLYGTVTTVKDVSRLESPAIGEAGEMKTMVPRKFGYGSLIEHAIKGSDAFARPVCVPLFSLRCIAGLGTL